jgi:hypothetical protein
MKFTCWFFLFALCACSKQEGPVGAFDYASDQFISLDFDERQEFILDSVFINTFIFSPFDENHLLVFTDYDGVYNLDLETKSWTRLVDTLDAYVRGIRPNAVHKDPFDHDKIWISNFNPGSALYHVGSKQLELLPELKQFNTIYFEIGNVWFGTWEGLYKYDRKEDSLYVMPGTAQLSIQEISRQSQLELNLDRRYVYNTHFNQLDKIAEAQAFTPLSLPYPALEVINNNQQQVTITTREHRELFSFPYYSWKNILFEENTMWIPSNELYEGMARIDVLHQNADTIPIGYYFSIQSIESDEQNVWITNPREIMIVNKQSGKANYWFLPFASEWRIEYQDLYYVYLAGRHGVQIIPKSIVLEESTPLEKIKAEEDLFNRLLDSTRISNTFEIRSWYEKYKRLKRAFSGTTSPRILASLDNIREMPSHMAPDEYMPYDTSLFSFFDSITDPDIQTTFVHSLMIYAVRKGLITKAIQLDQQWIKDSMVQDTNEYRYRQRKAIREAHDALHDLDSLPLQEDEKLWLTANIYWKLFEMVGREGEGGMNMDLPLTFYSELVTKFPTSQWADNAYYHNLSFYEGSSHEGGDNDENLDYIKDYKAFIRKFPDSELIPEAYLSIAQLYAYYFHDETGRLPYLREAKKYAAKLSAEYPLHPLVKEADRIKEYVQMGIDVLECTLTISLVKSSFTRNEPIEITYSLANMGDNVKSISLYQDDQLSNFHQSVQIGRPLPNERSGSLVPVRYTQNLNFALKDTLLSPGHTYVEVKDIRKWAKVYATGQQGYYTLDDAYEYSVTAYYQKGDFWITSNRISFTRR